MLTLAMQFEKALGENLVKKAKFFAKQKHEGQVDKADKDYFTGHLTRVAKAVEPFGAAYVAAAFLHDVVEDTPTSIEEVEELVGDEVAKAVALLTKPKEPNYDYVGYIDTIVKSGNDIAIRVKQADLADHLIDTSCLTKERIDKYEMAALQFVSCNSK